MAAGIYAITRTETGDCYVGSSQHIEKRWADHQSMLYCGTHHCRHLQRAWNKYGAASFELSVVEECAIDSLITREQHFINSMQSTYNEGRCAQVPFRGQKHTADARAKMSTAKRGRKLTPAHREALLMSLRGRPVSAETREKIANAQRGKPRAGHKHTSESKAKLSAAWARKREMRDAA